MAEAPPKRTFNQPEKVGDKWQIKIVDEYGLIHYEPFKTEEAKEWLKRGPSSWPLKSGSTK